MNKGQTAKRRLSLISGGESRQIMKCGFRPMEIEGLKHSFMGISLSGVVVLTTTSYDI
jgi:hypothetical protein